MVSSGIEYPIGSGFYDLYVGISCTQNVEVLLCQGNDAGILFVFAPAECEVVSRVHCQKRWAICFVRSQFRKGKVCKLLFGHGCDEKKGDVMGIIFAVSHEEIDSHGCFDLLGGNKRNFFLCSLDMNAVAFHVKIMFIIHFRSEVHDFVFGDLAESGNVKRVDVGEVFVGDLREHLFQGVLQRRVHIEHDEIFFSEYAKRTSARTQQVFLCEICLPICVLFAEVDFVLGENAAQQFLLIHFCQLLDGVATEAQNVFAVIADGAEQLEFGQGNRFDGNAEPFQNDFV